MRSSGRGFAVRPGGQAAAPGGDAAAPQGATLSPLTAAGIARVAPEDAGAASGVVNVAHQLGGSLGLGILVTVFAAADASGTLSANDLLAHRVSTSLAVGTGMLVLALVLVVALIVRPGSGARVGARRARRPVPATGTPESPCRQGRVEPTGSHCTRYR